MTLYLHFRVICFLLTFLNYASGFAINEYSNPTGYTHENITRGALDRVASIYIATILRPGRFDLQNQTTEEILKQYFEEVPSAGNIYDNAVDDIVKGLEDAEKKVQTSAKYSMNNEMITEGNMYLNLKRSQIESLSTDSSPNWSVVRMVVGDYLYTLQDFYSNTNWVELGGGTLNSLGWNDTLGIPVANDNQPTCKSCHAYNGTQNGACNGNIIAGHVLNSGYIDHSSTGQGGVKVFNSQWANGEGKCSHGGRHDSSRHLPATGGINKETTSTVLSPHYYLHSKAGKMATDATTDFFIRNESSLLTVVGYVRLGKLLGLNEQNHQSQCVNCNDPSLSIVFVIDTTGSMASDIFQVRQKAVEMVTKAMMPGYSPFNYIVVTFNDPASKTTYRVSKDGEEVKRWLNALTVDGGGDCPEYAMSGIKTAMQHARNGSCVFFFTDADPKDPDLRNDVVNLIRSKDLHLVSFITGQCHGQLQTSPPKNGTHNSGGEPLGCIAKSQGHRKKRGFGNFFQSLGGTYIPVKDRDISKPLDTLLEIINIVKLPFGFYEDPIFSKHSLLSGNILVIDVIQFPALLAFKQYRRCRPEKIDSRWNSTATLSKNMAITYVNIYTTKISSRSLDITVDSHISAFTVEIEDASSKPSSALYRPIDMIQRLIPKSLIWKGSSDSYRQRLDIFFFNITYQNRIEETLLQGNIISIKILVGDRIRPKIKTIVTKQLPTKKCTVETFSGKSSFNDIGRSTYIMSIVSPVPGIWMLKHMNSETWIVTVKQQGDIEFTYQFLEDVHGALLSIHGTPLAGSTLTLLVKVTDLTSDDCLVYGILLDETGTEITRMSLAQSSQGRKRTGIAVFNVPNKAFKIAIEGTEKGNVFKRQSKDLIHPASVSLQILQSDGNLYVDKDSTVISNVTNTGSTDETYQVHFTDTAGFTDSTVSVTVGAGMSKNVSLTIRGRKTHKTTILTTSLLLGGKEIQQQQTVFMVQPKIPPTININLKSSDCIPTFLNYFNCSKELINITATVETSSLNLYYTKPRLDLKMSNSSGKYVLSFSGTCCSPKFSWFVSDSDSQVTEKSFDFTNGHSFSTVIPVKKSHLAEVSKVSNSKAIYYGVGGAVAACVVTIGSIIIIVKVSGKVVSKVSNMKMTDLSEDVVENPRPRIPRSHLQQFNKK